MFFRVGGVWRVCSTCEGIQSKGHKPFHAGKTLLFRVNIESCFSCWRQMVIWLIDGLKFDKDPDSQRMHGICRCVEQSDDDEKGSNEGFN